LDPQNPDFPRDRIDYSFDLCSTEALLSRMTVKDGRLTLPDGMSYRLLVLPNVDTMTPKLLGKVKELAEAGATVVGSRPSKSPSLSDYPKCDQQVQELAAMLWGRDEAPEKLTERKVGKGRLFWSAAFQKKPTAAMTSKEQLHSAQWIWHPEGEPAVSAPPGKRFFCKSFSVDGDVKSARLAMTADNSFDAWIDGNEVLGHGDTHTRIFSFNVAHLLKRGENWISMEAVNATDAPSPAGLIGALTIEYQDGRTQIVVTDSTWKTAQKAEATWFKKEASGEGWAAAKVLGPVGMAPWGNLDAIDPNLDLYPEVDLVTEVLRKMDVRPDFTYRTQSGIQSLRYIHRNADGNDVYFVANRLPQRERAVCSFRVQGKRPEFWRPETGRIERAAIYEEADGAVRVPISFDPVESVFVIFREKSEPAAERIVSVARDGKDIFDTAWKAGVLVTEQSPKILPVEEPGVKLADGANHHVELQAVEPGKYSLRFGDGAKREIEVAALPAPIDLSGGWDVHFDPKAGGPEQVKFDKLVSWSDHADQGVKYYSGTATYTKNFNVPADYLAKNRKISLDLGRVEIMAEVKLNGKDLGILWKTPYRVELGDAIQAGENTLEVKVVNLPINRQIGDEFLPEDSDRNSDGTLKSWPKWLLEGKSSPTGRYTFTSWRLWHKTDALQPSGMMGPVRIIPAAVVELPAEGSR
jgi:hypothetical protein